MLPSEIFIFLPKIQLLNLKLYGRYNINNMNQEFNVITRGNKIEIYNEGAILGRIMDLSGNYHNLGKLSVNPDKVVDRVRCMIHDNIKTSEIDSLVAKCASDMILEHPDYMKFAGRITANNIHKQTPGTFSKCMKELYNRVLVEYHERVSGRMGLPKFINGKFFRVIQMNAQALDSLVDDSRDYIYTYNGYTQMKNTYLKKIGGELVDRPQYMYMRQAIALWAPRDENNDFLLVQFDDKTLKKIKKYYDLMSNVIYTHATPTILNSGFTGQMDSCFLLNVDDAIENITKVGGDIACISKMAGGIGLCYTSIRGKNTYIAGTNGNSSGIMPQLKIIEAHIKAWNQGGARKGAAAVFLSIMHRDIIEFIEMRNKSGGDSDAKCVNLFNAIWCHELFFERLTQYFDLKTSGNEVDANKITLPVFDSNDAVGSDKMFGEELKEIALKLERSGKCSSIKIASIIDSIVTAFAEAGSPYICNGDAANACSNMQNYGPICSSNLCTEIYLPTTSSSYACCTLANISLNRLVKTDPKTHKKYFDFEQLAKVTRLAIRALDRIVTINVYPVPECKKNAFDLRPLGLGIQGLADTFSELGFAYLSPEATKLDKQIFETMYYYALTESAELSIELGTYPYFEGSHLSQGIFHWEAFENYTGIKYEHARNDLDWESLRSNVRCGVRNATFLALMPTESTSKMMSHSPCIEPWYQHWYSNESDVNGRTELVNLNVLYKAIELGLWTPENIKVLEQTGSFPFEGIYREIYCSAYDMSIADYMKRVHYRQYMIDQGISTNIRHKTFNEGMIIKQLLLGRKLGLKTINYYVSIKPINGTVKLHASRVTGGIKDTEDSGASDKTKQEICRRDNKEACIMCL